MVLEALGLAGIAGAGRELFSYNRENFMFDREMRQKQEFQILAFRNKQAELWRDDIRDIIGMTEKKMDSYLVIATLQLGMCVGLFCEGRLEPGTPPWLLSFYMLALGGAFLYLLMAVWFAMHASVVANCSSVRLLTQFVRLPVPTWEHLEDLRTYASAYESVEWQHMLRIPFTGDRGTVAQTDRQAPPPPRPEASPGTASEASATPSAAASAGSAKPVPMAADPWGLERHGQRRDLYELEDKHPALRAHVGLARKACLQFQCFDAFARVGMTFGTNQLMNAIAYYCMGYLAVQDGAIWPSWCIVTIMLLIMTTLINIDVALSARRRAVAVLLQVTGPLLCVAATSGWVVYREHFEGRLAYMLPVAYAAHGLWLLWMLGAIGMEKQANGSVLPTKFRAVLYLDVFGWLNGQDLERLGYGAFATSGEASKDTAEAAELSTDLEGHELLPGERERRADSPRTRTTSALQAGIREGRFGPTTIAFGDGHGAPSHGAAGDPRGQPTSAQAAPGNYSAAEPQGAAESGSACPSSLSGEAASGPASGSPVAHPLEAAADIGTPMVKAFSLLLEEDAVMDDLNLQDGLGTEIPRDPAAPSQSGPHATHSVRVPPKYAYNPSSYGFGTKAVAEYDENADIVGGQETIHPGRLPAKVFRIGTALLAVLWILGVAYPIHHVRGFMTTPALGEVYAEEEREVDTLTGRAIGEMQVPGAMGTDPNGLPMFIPLPRQHEIPKFEHGELIQVEWPTHAGFFPRALSADDSGRRLVVADDIGLYFAELTQADATPSGNATSRRAGATRLLRGADDTGSIPAVDRPVARFSRVGRCAATEGQNLRDMSVVCTRLESRDYCKVLVLVSLGPTIAECPLPQEERAAERAPRADERPKPARELAGGRTGNVSWTVASDWLYKDVRPERLDALAVDSDCLKVGSRHSPQPGMCRFEAADAGCVVVGTSFGRIVQLRGDIEGTRQLVPERKVHQRAAPVTHGSLAVLPSGAIVALARKLSVSDGEVGQGKKTEAIAEAFDGEAGDLIGQWELPKDVDWITLSGGGDSLLALGLRDRRELQLYKFPVPPELRARKDSRLPPFVG